MERVAMARVKTKDKAKEKGMAVKGHLVEVQNFTLVLSLPQSYLKSRG